MPKGGGPQGGGTPLAGIFPKFQGAQMNGALHPSRTLPLRR